MRQKNKTKMQATSTTPMNQISQHALYMYAQSEVYHGIYAESKTNLWQMKTKSRYLSFTRRLLRFHL